MTPRWSATSACPARRSSYKLGERAWLAGREAARARAASEGRELDLRAWHMAALGTGALGLDDLARDSPPWAEDVLATGRTVTGRTRRRPVHERGRRR
ncbi:DUF885 family protein [Aquipuribacter hungaricus]|uniref:DUF885 family protein n=1 Tax=Aquipuribacter hungaricus TaxID=545624 RepID=UPI00361E5BE7